MDFRALQEALMAHIRDPQQHPAPAGIEDRRLAIYRRLFFNNVEGFLASAFPVLKSLYQGPDWQALARRFYADHDCKSPLFLDISGAFLDYLDSPAFQSGDCDPPFIRELAHYEWLELEVGRAEEEGEPLGELHDGTALRFSGAARLAAYPWPVHQISIDFRPTEPLESPLFLLVYRDWRDGIGFTVLNAATAALLELVVQRPGIRLAELKAALSAWLGMKEEELAPGLQETLADLGSKAVLRKN
ncbi:putative DNA-binding domain-containing protein [Gallaecimonas kandeliae]|uniref:HvfC family RiPP maturation protein n=1 Tax=Gallaecimonas kandeliae TaxID=3029055 RepID=UPI002649A219|nr:putative DNA-binding domain-containing protein [Gallaecimonas kandeliae]WKE64441.1 putative DNA-binding domain-containing protein [Gallaecimonas kandeliae]